MGTYIDSGTGKVKVTTVQCYKLLKAQWPHVTYSFGKLFAGFTGPTGATATQLVAIKSVLQQWILQFGPYPLTYDPDWTPLIAAFKTADWSGFLGWLGSSPGYTLDAGTTIKTFPKDLETWLFNSCVSTQTCSELAVLNSKSTVCANASCLTSVKVPCGLLSGSVCQV